MTLQPKFTLKPKSLIGILKDFRANGAWQLYCCTSFWPHPPSSVAILSGVVHFLFPRFSSSPVVQLRGCFEREPDDLWTSARLTSYRSQSRLSLNYSNLLLKLVNVELQKDIDNLFAPSSLVAHNLSLPTRTIVISLRSLIQRCSWRTAQKERERKVERENISNSDPILSYLISV